MQIEFWHWLIVVVIMLILTMVVSAAEFLWMAISAFAVGLLILMVPTTTPLIQVIVFGVSSIITLYLYKRHKELNPARKNKLDLNRRGEQYIGRTFTLEEPIINGVGKIKVDDSIWKVMGLDMPAGSKVRITSIDGTIFNVELETSYS